MQIAGAFFSHQHRVSTCEGQEVDPGCGIFISKMTDSNLRVIRRENVVIIAIARKTAFQLLDLPACQFIRMDMSPAVIDQKPAVARPIGRFNDIVELFEHRSDA